ncbi:N-acetylneuraminate synthase family protein, partial [Vibrio cholerae]|nr:N-acetylneuraminate synthase family protein [Vibrio cholerae]
EKHVTLDRSAGGPDDSFSLDPNELTRLCQDARTAWSALGCATYERTEAEKGNVKFRRSLYVVQDIAAGEVLTAKNIRSIRPGFGLEPRYYDDVIGKKAISNLPKGKALQKEDISIA